MADNSTEVIQIEVQPGAPMPLGMQVVGDRVHIAACGRTGKGFLSFFLTVKAELREKYRFQKKESWAECMRWRFPVPDYWNLGDSHVS